MRVRPAILFTVCYGAGLMTGLLHFGAPVGAAVALGVGALLWRQPLAGLIGAALILGRISGEIARLQETFSCTSRLPPGRIQLEVRLVDPADQAGGRLEIRPLRQHCRGNIGARWPAGQPGAAGTVARVEGRWIRRPAERGRHSGTFVVLSLKKLSVQPSMAERIRTSLSSASHALYGTRAPMVDALILGRRGGMDSRLQDRFAQSGLVHLLSISGFHVGVISAWVFLLCRIARIGRSRALALAAAVSVAYVGFLGWPAPAARAAALAVLVAISRIRQRRIQADALLSATCLCVLLLDPWAALDLGGWLSVAALWGATTFTQWTDRSLGTSVWWRTLGSSVGATLATAPITAAALGTVAMVGIALNFVAIPVAAVAVPGVFISLLVFPLLPELARALAAGSGLALHLLELLAAAGSAVPGGHIIRPAEVQSAAPWLLSLAAGLWAIGKRNTLGEAARRWSWAFVAALWFSLLQAGVSGYGNTGSGLTLHFLDVGQGDGAVLRTPTGRWLLIDAGPRSEHTDAGRRVVVPFLAGRGVRELAVAFISHAHADHLGGVLSVLDRFPTGLVVEPGEQVADPLYYRFLDELDADGVPWHIGHRGERFTLDSVSFTILHPDRRWAGWGEDLNEDSLVLLIEYGAFQVLFSGDAGFPAEAEMRGHIRGVDLLKVGHHGSRGSTGDEWLDSLRPRAGIISVGQNKYGHPSPETLGRLRRHGVAVWRTDHDGSLTVRTDGRRMTIESRGRSMSYDVR